LFVLCAICVQEGVHGNCYLEYNFTVISFREKEGGEVNNMKKPFVLFMFLGVCCFNARIARACYICGGGGGGGYPSCMVVSGGAEVCVGQSQPPFCSTYYNDCCQGCGCAEDCGGPYCCVGGKSIDGKKKACPSLKKSAFQLSGDGVTLPQPQQKRYQDHFQDFLALVEKGEFDGKVVYIHSDNPIMKGIMQMPVSHWKSFSQKVVLQGWKQDPRLDPKVQKKGTPQVLIEVETKTGHNFTIHVTNVEDVKKALDNSKDAPPQL
jgi:hypothetical protein